MGIHGSSTTPIFRKTASPEKNLLHKIGAAKSCVQYPECRALLRSALPAWAVRKHVLMHLFKICEGAQSVWKTIGDFGLMRKKLGGDGRSDFAVNRWCPLGGNIEAAMAAASGSGDKIQTP